LKLASLEAACGRGGRCWVCVRSFINSRLVIRTVGSRVSPDKKIARHLQDSKYQDDDADNHYERDEDMHTEYIASRPLTDNTRIQKRRMTPDEKSPTRDAEP
jgi:hypothetical protein